MKDRILWTILVLGIYIFTAPLVPAQSTNVEKFALIIGITGYPNFPTEEKLEYADDDAKAFYDFILSPAGGSFPENNVKLLRNGEATRREIDKYVEWLGQVTRPYENAVVYVFFAGHGVADDMDRVYLMPYEAQKTSPYRTGIRANRFFQDLDENVNARHLMLFIDACYAGAVVTPKGTTRGTRNVSAEFIRAWNESINRIDSIRMGLLSASSNQLSHEDPQSQHGLFTRFVLQGLKGDADRNPKDGRVNAGELYRYVLDGVDQTSVDRFKSRQTPISSPRFDPNLTLSILPSIKDLNPQLSYIRFFPQETVDAPARAKRQYGERFDNINLRYVNWELSIKVPAPGADVKFRIDAVWHWLNGTTSTNSKQASVKDTWTNVYFTGNRFGFQDPGKWAPGLYKVDFFFDGEKFASQSFTISTAGNLSFETQNPRLKFVKFFELGKGEDPPREQRLYANTFSANSTRFMLWEIEILMENPPVDLQFNIDTVWYGPDGSVIWRETTPTTVKKEWTGVNQRGRGYGWEKGGNWKPGRYSVDFFVNQKKIASGAFEITDAGPTFETQNPRVNFVKFFEFGKGEVPPKAQRQYATIFPRYSTRYIFWEIEILMVNPVVDLKFNIDTVWYGPDGKLIWRESPPTTVKKEWNGVNKRGPGYGWETGGNWRVGRYRVDFFVNQKKIASKTFDIE